jgi:hypothetical protein
MEREPSESIVREIIKHLKFLSMEEGLYGWLHKEKVSDARKYFVMPSGNISQEGVKNINNNVSSNRKFEFKKAPQDELTALPCYNYTLGKWVR